MSDSQREEPNIAPLEPGEERLLQTVHRADGNRNDIYLVHRRPSDDETTGAGEAINFVAVIRYTDEDPNDTEPPWAWQRGPTERRIYIALAEAIVNAPPLPGSSVSLDPQVEWFADRIRESAGPAPTAMETAAKFAQQYVVSCGEVLSAADACLEVANRAAGARNSIAHHQNDGLPGTSIALRNFATWAEHAEQEFVPLYLAFDEACATARGYAAQLLSAGPLRAEMVLAMSYGEDVLDRVATAKGILGATFGPTPAAFLQGVEAANALMQNPTDDGNIYRPHAPTTGPRSSGAASISVSSSLQPKPPTGIDVPKPAGPPGDGARHCTSGGCSVHRVPTSAKRCPECGHLTQVR